MNDNDLISRREMLEALDHFNDYVNGDPHFLNGIETAKEITENLPTVDAVPVVHGQWKFVAWHGGLKVVECSICGKWAYGATVYCPHCAAKIDGEADER